MQASPGEAGHRDVREVDRMIPDASLAASVIVNVPVAAGL